MFGLGFSAAYGSIKLDFLGGASAALLYSLVVRIAVGVGWYRLFERTGQKGWYAFVPILGPYTAFRLVWDDFSFAAIFGMTTFVAWINAVGISHPIINACAVVNFILWWFMALLMARSFQVNTFLGLLYGGIPWLGVPVLGFYPVVSYRGPWSSDPEADQNLTAQERKKRRKKAAKAAKQQGSK